MSLKFIRNPASRLLIVYLCICLVRRDRGTPTSSTYRIYVKAFNKTHTQTYPAGLEAEFSSISIVRACVRACVRVCVCVCRVFLLERSWCVRSAKALASLRALASLCMPHLWTLFIRVCFINLHVIQIHVL